MDFFRILAEPGVILLLYYAPRFQNVKSRVRKRECFSAFPLLFWSGRGILFFSGDDFSHSKNGIRRRPGPGTGRTFMRTSHLFWALCFSALLLVCPGKALCGGGSAPGCLISTLRITGGANAVSLPVHAGAYCNFKLVNRGGSGETVRISIRSEEKADDADACFRAEIFAPARSEQFCWIPFQLDRSKTYFLSASPRSVSVAAPEFSTMPVREGEHLYVLLTDSQSQFGSFAQLPAFRGKALVYQMRAHEIPQHVHVLESFDAVLLDRSDFLAWSSLSFDAVIQYVNNGGTLCFTSGETALAAAGTPLAGLLPVVPLSLSREDFFPEIVKLSGGYSAHPFGPQPFVFSKERPGAKTVLSGNGFPLFAEWKRGKGTVRFSAVDLSSPELRSFRNGKAWTVLLTPFLKSQKIPPRKIRYTDTRLRTGSGWKIFANSEKSVFAVLAVCALLLAAGLSLVRCFVKNRAVVWGIGAVCGLGLILVFLLMFYQCRLLPRVVERALERIIVIEITGEK